MRKKELSARDGHQKCNDITSVTGMCATAAYIGSCIDRDCGHMQVVDACRSALVSGTASIR